MSQQHSNRRTFLKAVAGTLGTMSLPAAATLPIQAASDTARSNTIRVGMPLFEAPHDPEELAAAHRKLGLRAAYCPGVTLEDRDRIKEIIRAFQKHDVVLAEVGRWRNLLEADPVKRKENFDYVIEGLALAEAV